MVRIIISLFRLWVQMDCVFSDQPSTNWSLSYLCKISRSISIRGNFNGFLNIWIVRKVIKLNLLGTKYLTPKWIDFWLIWLYHHMHTSTKYEIESFVYSIRFPNKNKKKIFFEIYYFIYHFSLRFIKFSYLFDNYLLSQCLQILANEAKLF